jgi:hypothetical protein
MVQILLGAGAIAVQTLKAAVSIIGDELWRLHRRSIALQIRPEPKNYPGADTKLRAAVRIRV